MVYGPFVPRGVQIHSTCVPTAFFCGPQFPQKCNRRMWHYSSRMLPWCVPPRTPLLPGLQEGEAV